MLLWGYLDRTPAAGVGIFSRQLECVWARDLRLARAVLVGWQECPDPTPVCTVKVDWWGGQGGWNVKYGAC